MQSQPAASARLQSQPAIVSAQQIVELPPPYETPSLKKSGLGAFGWLLLAALLFGGVGALLYVALGERGERAPSRLEATQPPARRAEEATPAPGSAADPSRPAVGGVKAPDSDAEDSKVDPKRPATRAPIKRPPLPPPAVTDERDPKALLRQGKAHEKAGDWEAARQVYQKLEKIRGYAGPALYQQAWVALNMSETDQAIQLVLRSAAQPGTHKTDAKFLYGDALYKQGEFKRAKEIFLSLRKTLTGEPKRTATLKVAAANRALKLPDNDGIEE
jgi:TolA-binding protein